MVPRAWEEPAKPVTRWGVIADDVTGACDVAAELRELGLEVVVMLGVPDAADVRVDADAVVVGLGIRTAPRERAVGETLATADALRTAGITRWYQKYCSTFDSTDEGMIGPVAEALIAAGGFRGSAGTPATPHADRTVYRGHLFVGDRLVSESSLAHHPLTPMTDPDLVRVLGRQTAGEVALVPARVVRAGSGAIAREIAASAADHLLFDASDDTDLDAIAAALDDPGLARLPGGGAGLITAVGRRYVGGSTATKDSSEEPVCEGPGLILMGSASEQSRLQLAAAGGPTVVIDAVRAAEHPASTVASAVAAAHADLVQGRRPVISAGHDRAAIDAAQRRLGTARAAEAVESALAAVALAAVAELGARRLLIAGGETSGAVARALGLRALRLQERVDPGVAWVTGRATAVTGQPAVGVLLKSGNFGGTDLLTRAWRNAP